MVADMTGTLDTARSSVTSDRIGAKRLPSESPDIEGRARELLTMAAHDLRSPLAAIAFRSFDVVQRWKAGKRPSCEEWASVVLEICAAAEDASSMINDLLAMERFEQNGRRSRRPAMIDVQTVIEKAIDREKLLLERRRCQVTVLRKKGFAAARGPWDPVYLLRIFGNLLRNVAKHAAGAPILITLARRGDRLGIQFSDRGPGLPPEQRPSARVSCRGDNHQAEAEIHGLGLWIVRRAVHRLDGQLRIRSRAGAGATFDIELPKLER
jgi:signal transduction histidine kinase